MSCTKCGATLAGMSLKEKLAHKCRKRRPKNSPQELRDLESIDKLMHPNGRCECGGEGRCAWCVQSQGVKFDGGKNRMALFPPEAMRAISRVLTHGAKKYDSHNWRKGMEWSRYADALLRHLFAWLDGEDIDPDSGEPHMAHVGCNAAFLIASQERKLGTDDRWKP